MTAVLVAAVIFFLLVTLPPAPLQADWRGDPVLAQRTIAGAYHVHTNRSDGAKARASVAAAAAEAGLQFIIFTDHGDGTGVAEPPAYLSGVLCVDGVEISTDGGHYVALGMSAAPYPLGGEPAAVVEDVSRLGGFGIIAHPDSLRPELAWTDWTVPFEGIEWMNADSEWRNEPRTRVARVLFDYMVRPGQALAGMLDRPDATLAQWDSLSRTRQVVALAGHDAHGGIGKGIEDGGRRGISLPSYEASFQSFSSRAVLEGPLSGDAAADASALLQAIRTGRVFTAIDAVAGPALLDLRVQNGGVTADAAMPAGAELALLRDGVSIATSRNGHVRAAGEPGAFRVEVRVPGSPGVPPVPWVVSNAVYAVPPMAEPAEDEPFMFFDPVPSTLTWHVEQDPSSVGTLKEIEGRTELDYRLGSGERDSVFTAAALDLPRGTRPAQALAFRIRGSQSMRVSVQLRVSGGERWGRSVHVDSDETRMRVELDQMRPLDGQTGPPPDPSVARTLLFVVDRTNARPGSSGTFAISALAFGRREGP